MSSVVVSNQAFAKLQLHAAKYPHLAVNGILLACKDTLANEDTLLIVDAIPLFHQCLQLTLMLEAAMTSVDAYCKQEGLQIAGYYEAPEHLEEKAQPSMFACRVGEVFFSFVNNLDFYFN